MGGLSRVSLRCNVCGLIFLTDFTEYDGRVCGKGCWIELDTRRSYSLVGEEKLQPYEPLPDNGRRKNHDRL